MFELRIEEQKEIEYKGKKLCAYHIKNFPKSIFVDLAGNLYMTYWPTPDARDEKKERELRLYKEVYSLLRGVIQTMERTKTKRLPDLEGLTQDCMEIGAEIRDIRAADEKDIEFAQRSMASVLEKIRFAQTPELKEASEKICFAIIFRDRLGRINIGMVSARLVAVKNRLVERIQNILSWMKKYAEWKQSIEAFVLFHKNYLPRLAQRVKNLIDHDAYDLINSGKTQVLARKLNNIWIEIHHLASIGGWKHWCSQVRNDIVECVEAIEALKNEKAMKCLDRIWQSTLLKIAQYKIHELLLHIDIELAQDVFRKHNHITGINRIIGDIQYIKEEGWRNPVCTKILTLLRMARSKLQKTLVDIKAINGSKESLRTAYQII